MNFLIFLIFLSFVALVDGSPMHSSCSEEKARVSVCYDKFFPQTLNDFVSEQEMEEIRVAFDQFKECSGELLCPRFASAARIDEVKLEIQSRISPSYQCLKDNRLKEAYGVCGPSLIDSCDGADFTHCITEQLASQGECRPDDLDVFTSTAELFSKLCSLNAEHNHKYHPDPMERWY